MTTEEMRVYMLKYYEKNKEKLRAYHYERNKKRRLSNPKKHSEYMKEYRRKKTVEKLLANKQ